MRSIEQVVQELVYRYVITAPDQGLGSTDPLRDRVRALVPASQQVLKVGAGGGHRAVVGSPAPWTARAAELLDEMDRGVVDVVQQARDVLGRGPLERLQLEVDWDSIAVDPPLVGGRRRLERADLNVDWRARPSSRVRRSRAYVGFSAEVGVQGVHPASRVPVPGVDVAAALCWPVLVETLRDLEGVNVELAEWMGRMVRSWHRRAVLLVGDAFAEWERVPASLGNPWWRDPAVVVEGGSARDRLLSRPSLGATCTPDHTPGRCWHESCWALRRTRMRQIPVVCPLCGHRSLLEHVITGEVRCGCPECASRGVALSWPSLGDCLWLWTGSDRWVGVRRRRPGRGVPYDGVSLTVRVRRGGEWVDVAEVVANEKSSFVEEKERGNEQD